MILQTLFNPGSSQGFVALFQKSLNPWYKDLESYLTSLRTDPHWWVLPGVVMAVHRFFGSEYSNELHHAVIFTLIYLADHIHCRVKDAEQGQLYDESLQFSILIGDLLTGRAIQLLAQLEGGQHMLEPIADMMAELGEGHTLKKLAGDNATSKTIAQEKAAFYRYAFEVGAMAAGRTAAEVKEYAAFGQEIGEKLSKRFEGMPDDSALSLDKAKSFLIKRAKNRGPEMCELVRLLDELFTEFNPPLAVAGY